MGNGPAGGTRRGLRARACIVSVLLIFQFFAGMVANLYVTIPDDHPGANASNFFTGAADSVAWAITSAGGWLAVHAALGLALAIGSIELIVRAARCRSTGWIWVSVLGTMFMIGAGFNGASFLVFNKDFSSLIMAGLFGLSLGTYLLGLYLDPRAGAPRPS